MILLSLTAASLAATAQSDWRPYAVGGFGFGDLRAADAADT